MSVLKKSTLNLLIIRHAIAMDRREFRENYPQASEDSRPLTKEGRRKMEKNARGLKRLTAQPDLLLSSPLQRARETLVILKREWPEVLTAISEELRPEKKPERFSAWLFEMLSTQRDLQNAQTIALVGHEPGLSQLIAWCVGSEAIEPFELRKGGACMIEMKQGEGEPIQAGSGALNWFLTPKILRSVT